MKIDLTNTTFMIPIRVDHQDRIDNLNIVLDYLNYHLDTNIIVCEESRNSVIGKEIKNRAKYMYLYSDSDHMHRTKALNYMIRESSTSVVVTYDSDVLLRPEQYKWSQDKIINNEADVVYPYNGWFCSITRDMIPDVVKSTSIKNIDYTKIKRPGHKNSLGAAIFFNKKSYIDGGMENQNFINYGWEDEERYHRFVKLGYTVVRHPSDNIIHLFHHRGPNSKMKHSMAKNNQNELEKIKNMTSTELSDYISTWEWCNEN